MYTQALSVPVSVSVSLSLSLPPTHTYRCIYNLIELSLKQGIRIMHFLPTSLDNPYLGFSNINMNFNQKKDSCLTNFLLASMIVQLLNRMNKLMNKNYRLFFLSASARTLYYVISLNLSVSIDISLSMSVFYINLSIAFDIILFMFVDR